MPDPSSASDSAPDPVKPSKQAVFRSRLLSTLILWALVTTGVMLNLDWLFFLIIGGLAVLGLLESLRMFRLHVANRYYVWTIGLSLAYLGTTFYHCQTVASAPQRVYFAHLDIFFLCLHVFGLFSITMLSDLEGELTLKRILGATFAFIYVIFLFTFMTRVLYLPAEHGVFYALYCVAVTKFTDMGAYLLGTLCGKHKMIPHISPGKTWEGFVGALLGAFAASLLVYLLFQEKLGLFTLTHALILPLALGIAAVLGDLAESVVKRCANVKDSGNMLPGIGGALDLIDSLCFTAPVMYLYMNYVMGLSPTT